MRTTVRDLDRQAVYDVEDAAFAGTIFAEPVAFEEAAGVLGDFCVQGWWAARALPVPTVHPTRSDSRTSYVAAGSTGPSVHLSPDGCAVSVIAHELAHVLAGQASPASEPEPGHGPGFRRAEVVLAGTLMGLPAGERLAQAFAAAGLPLGPVLTGIAAPPRLGYWATWRAERLRGAARPPATDVIIL